MKQSERTKTPVVAGTLLMATLFLCGCASHMQYRTNLTPAKTTGEDPQYATTAIEDGGSYVLGFVEFDDQGWLWSRKQLDAVMDRLREEERQQRIVILAFVHGWQHNAKYDDSNVEMVRQNLRLLNRLERLNSKREGRSPRKFVGVYAGWRGMAPKPWGLKNFSFWERKNTAHEVGRGALCELFLRLEDLRNISHILHAGEKEQTRLIIVGHSFGGAATYSALASLLVERAIETIDENGNGHPPRGFGDLVMLVNPAFEASRYGVLEDIATRQTYLVSNLVNLAIFTSKTDDATKIAFPLGRRASTLFEKHQSGFEAKANVTAVGHFTPYITHDLIATEKVPSVKKSERLKEPTTEEMERTSERVVQLRTQSQRNTTEKRAGGGDFAYHFVGSDLKPRPGRDPWMPLYVVSVDSKIIPDHNGIDRPAFLRFLRQFITTFEPQGR
jgi:hypothetical protein